jgi:hypothetical protein
MTQRKREDEMKTNGLKPEARVGIFWVVNGEMLIDSTPLSEAEPYGDYLTHPRGHAEVWEQYQQTGAVPSDMEYEESPRGRVIYNTKTQRFRFLADKCILREKSVVRKIMLALHLPRNTQLDEDSHYRCSSCSRRKVD